MVLYLNICAMSIECRKITPKCNIYSKTKKGCDNTAAEILTFPFYAVFLPK